MKPQMIVLALVLAALAACGPAEDDKIVLRQPDGTEMTRQEVIEKMSTESFRNEVGDCRLFALIGSTDKGMEFPSGQAAFIAACEEALKSP